MLFVLIIFILEISLIKKIYWQIVRKDKNINKKDNFKKSYKFKTNLLLSIN